MKTLSRRSLLRTTIGLAAAGTLARPHIANAQAKTATMWVVQGFVPEEDSAYRKLVADYEKQSGNRIDYSIVPFAPMRDKEVSAITSGDVPDLMETADFAFPYRNAWENRLTDVSDIFDTQKAQFSKNAHECSFAYNDTTKQRSYYIVPWKSAAVPFHIWGALVEKAGYKTSDIPDKWDAFIDFFAPVQDKLRREGMRNIYAYGYQLTATGVDPINTFNAFMIAHGGKDLVTPDGKLHTDDPKVRQAARQGLVQLTTAFKKGYVPPGVVSWNDADDNNAFHSKLIVMDFDGTISTEVALYHNKPEYDAIVTRGLPLSNSGQKLPAQVATGGVMIPKGAKNVAVAKEFMTYVIQPKVLNEYLKAGLGRWVIPMPEMAKSDPFWLADPHRKPYTEETLFGPTLAIYEAYNPAMAQVGAEEVFSVAENNVMLHGMAPEQAIAAAFKRVEEIFTKYPIQQA